MKSNLISILFVCICLGVGGVLYYYYRVAPEMEISNLELKDLKENSFNSYLLEGKIVIVSFYKSWCGPCMRELINFEKLSKLHENQVVFLCISDEQIEIQRRVVERFSEGNLFFLQSSKQFEDLKIRTFPTNYIIDKNGKVVFKSASGNGISQEELKDYFTD